MRRRFRYDKDKGKVVEVTGAARDANTHHVMSDIQPFTTSDGVEITSRSKLREYERRTGTRQLGNDWPGSSKPAFWDRMTNGRN